jgi:glycerol uptake facilitator-like aquaporin
MAPKRSRLPQPSFKNNHDVERGEHNSDRWLSVTSISNNLKPATNPFTRHVSRVQDSTLSRNGSKTTDTFRRFDDAAPTPYWKPPLDLQGIVEEDVWRFSGMGATASKTSSLNIRPISENYHESESGDHASNTGLSRTPTSEKMRPAVCGIQDHAFDSYATENTLAPDPPDKEVSLMSWRESLDLRGILDRKLWKLAGVEAIGTMLLTFVSAFVASHPPSTESTSASIPQSGVFGTPTFLGSLVGGVITWLILMFLIYSFGALSGGHLNPLISMATFCARLITLPRMILYIGGQLVGAALAGRALIIAHGSADFVVGGCNVDLLLVPVQQALMIELMFTLTLIFVAFGVGLNPRQASIFGGILSPWLIGMILGLLVFCSSFSRPGYEGAGETPFRSFVKKL